MEIRAVRIAERIPRPLFDHLFSFLSPDQQERCRRFLRIEDAERLLTADLLVRHYLCLRYGWKNETLRFGRSAYGKPYLKNDLNIRFNVAHSGEWVVAAFDRNEIGIDVERVRPIDISIAERFFSEIEYRDLMRRGEQERTGYFFDLWVLKESYIKAVGKGLLMETDRFSFRIEERAVHFEPEDGPDPRFFFRQYQIHPLYKLAVCARHEGFPRKIEQMTIRQIAPEIGRTG